MGLIEKIFKGFFHYKSMRAIDHQSLRLGQFAPKGFWLAGFKWGGGGALDVSTYFNIYGFRFFHNTVNTCSYIDPLGVTTFDPKGLIGRIYVGVY